MKLREILAEKKRGSISKRQQYPSTGINIFSDAERADSTYTEYRLGLALAMADGKNKPEVDAKTWHGKKKTAHPYTELEQKMLKDAYAIVGANHQDINKGDLRSQETPDTHKVSPVMGKKRNKYGV